LLGEWLGPHTHTCHTQTTRPCRLRRGEGQRRAPFGSSSSSSRGSGSGAGRMDDDNSYVYEGSDAEEEYAYSDGEDDAGVTPVMLPQVRVRLVWGVWLRLFACLPACLLLSGFPSSNPPPPRPAFTFIQHTLGIAGGGVQDHRQRRAPRGHERPGGGHRRRPGACAALLPPPPVSKSKSMSIRMPVFLPLRPSPPSPLPPPLLWAVESCVHPFPLSLPHSILENPHQRTTNDTGDPPVRGGGAPAALRVEQGAGHRQLLHGPGQGDATPSRILLFACLPGLV
jgi:hypothetical protein